MNTIQANLQLIRFRPWIFALHSIPAIFYVASRVIPGWIEKGIFDTLTGDAPAAIGVAGLLVLLAGVEAARIVASFTFEWYGVSFRVLIQTLLRRNLLAHILSRPGADALSVATGDALNRFDNDVAEVADFPTWIPEVVAHALFALIATTLMWQLHPTLTLVAVLPLLSVAIIVRFARDRLLRYADASRAADSTVIAFLGETLGAVQAVKVASAEEGVIRRFDQLNEVRRHANLREHLFYHVIVAASDNSADLALGLVLLLAGRALLDGSFTVGDFALFSYYLFFLPGFPGAVGGFFSDYSQQHVSLRRMTELIPGAGNAELTQHAPIHETGPLPEVPLPTRRPEERLERVAVRALRYHHPLSAQGIEGIDLEVARGEMVVVTGRVGSGKSTLLRALTGLLPAQGGEVYWNGTRVATPATFFVPPRSAYTPQVPRLFSEPLRDNVLLGLPESEVDLPGAIHMAVLEPDLATMAAGLDTVVGPRGVRLSGGQVQRTAAARMIVRMPELLLVDDLSSALDVETEGLLWQRLFARAEPPTCLVVSHRRPVLRRADRILLLHEGRVADSGTLDELLARSALMRGLWEEEEQGE